MASSSALPEQQDHFPSGGGGGGPPGRGPPPEEPGSLNLYHIETIRKALETTEITLEGRPFSRVEVRKMLHPEMDVTSITPFEPVRSVRVDARQKPFTRWKFYEELDTLEQGEQAPGTSEPRRPGSVPAGSMNPGFGLGMGRRRGRVSDLSGGLEGRPGTGASGVGGRGLGKVGHERCGRGIFLSEFM